MKKIPKFLTRNLVTTVRPINARWKPLNVTIEISKDKETNKKATANSSLANIILDNKNQIQRSMDKNTRTNEAANYQKQRQYGRHMREIFSGSYLSKPCFKNGSITQFISHKIAPI